MPNLEPYRREVVAQQSTTFGHRPRSASRMFNPSTMATSCGRPAENSESGAMRGGSVECFKGSRAGGKSKKQTASTLLPLGKGSRVHASMLTAPMLKELLFRDASSVDELARDSSMLYQGRSTATAPASGSHGRSKRELFQLTIGNARDATTGITSSVAFANGNDVASATSSAKKWRSDDPSARGDRGNIDTSWLSSSIQDMNMKNQGGVRNSMMKETTRRDILFPEVRTIESFALGQKATNRVRFDFLNAG